MVIGRKVWIQEHIGEVTGVSRTGTEICDFTSTNVAIIVSLGGLEV